MASRVEFTVLLGNEPSPFLKLFAALEREDVKIDALSQTQMDGSTSLRFVASPTTSAKRVLHRSDLEFTSRKVLVVKTAGDPGALHIAQLMLFSRHVDVNYMYSGSAGDRTRTIVVGVSDVTKAERVVSGMRQYSD